MSGLGGGVGLLKNKSNNNIDLQNSCQQNQQPPQQQQQQQHQNESNKNRICREFIRGLCRRIHCRYPHVLSPDLVVFCHDFQNSNCPRKNCKFLHYALEEEEYYRKFGEFPQEYLDNSLPPSVQPPPSHICKDYIVYGSCRHRDCYVAARDTHLPPPHMLQCGNRERLSNIHYGMSDHRLINDYRIEDTMPLKRQSNFLDSLDNNQYKRYRDDIDVIAVIRRFEEEQIMVRRRVEANEIKIAELRASNEYLMAQNAQLRLSNQVQQQNLASQQASQAQTQSNQQQQNQLQNNQQSNPNTGTQQQQCSSIVNPVTVTQTTSQAQPTTVQIGPAAGVSIAQVQATPIVSIATPQTQIITNNSGQPVAIASNTSQGQQIAAIAQQNITSLSNATSQAGAAIAAAAAAQHAQQILGTSQITLTPALAQGLTINTSMSNGTQPMISYPVMTHSILPH